MIHESKLEALLRGSIEISNLKAEIKTLRAEIARLQARLNAPREFDMAADAPVLLRPQV